MGKGRTGHGDPGSCGEGAGPGAEYMWAPFRRGAPRAHHGGLAAASGTGGGGLHGEDSGEREYPEDAGSQAGADFAGPAAQHSRSLATTPNPFLQQPSNVLRSRPPPRRT